LAERVPSKHQVAGSRPVSRSKSSPGFGGLLVLRMVRLHRYWVELKAPETRPEAHSRLWLLRFGLGERRFGCGVTAYTPEDALWLIQRDVFRGKPLPEVEKVIEDVDVSTLDAFNDPHLKSNFGVPIWRGIWFPNYL
jgi:hypothetical protein